MYLYLLPTVYPKKYAHGFCFAVLCCGYTLNDFPMSIRLTSLALWQSNDCPSASKATLMNMDKYFMWIHYERLHSHNKAKHNKTVCIFLGIYCITPCGLGIIYSRNGLTPVQRAPQPITKTNADHFSTCCWETNAVQWNKKIFICFKMPSARYQWFCSSPNVLYKSRSLRRSIRVFVLK